MLRLIASDLADNVKSCQQRCALSGAVDWITDLLKVCFPRGEGRGSCSRTPRVYGVLPYTLGAQSSSVLHRASVCMSSDAGFWGASGELLRIVTEAGAQTSSNSPEAPSLLTSDDMPSNLISHGCAFEHRDRDWITDLLKLWLPFGGGRGGVVEVAEGVLPIALGAREEAVLAPGARAPVVGQRGPVVQAQREGGPGILHSDTRHWQSAAT